MAETLSRPCNARSLDGWPRLLRNAAAQGPEIEITTSAGNALVLARMIERDKAGPAVIVVDRTPPFAPLAIFFFGLMASAQLCAMLTPGAIWLARILAGWLNG